MEMWLFAVVALALLNGTSRSTDGRSTVWIGPQGGTIREKVERIPRYLQGRVLGSFVQMGMTPEEVKPLLGGGYLSSGGLVGPIFWTSMKWFNLGVWVRFRADEKGVQRVDAIAFFPLWDSSQRPPDWVSSYGSSVSSLLASFETEPAAPARPVQHGRVWHNTPPTPAAPTAADD